MTKGSGISVTEIFGAKFDFGKQIREVLIDGRRMCRHLEFAALFQMICKVNEVISIQANPFQV